MADKLQQVRYKGGVCLGCPRTVDDVLARYGTIKRVFQFHHVDPETKNDDYENLIRRSISAEQLDELDKCALLCSFCHGLVEETGIDMSLRLVAEVEGRRCEQVMRGQGLFDRLERHLRFVTNERVKLTPYWVQLGRAPRHLEYEIELTDGGSLVRYLREIETHRRIILRSWQDGRVMLAAGYLKCGSVRVCYQVACPVFACDLHGETNVWTRNGYHLTDDGDIGEEGIVVFEMPVPR